MKKDVFFTNIDLIWFDSISVTMFKFTCGNTNAARHDFKNVKPTSKNFGTVGVNLNLVRLIHMFSFSCCHLQFVFARLQLR